MAGKTKKRGYRASSGNNFPQGHLGLKSSALCPTDSKLISQHLVQNKMEAHYRKLIKVKAAVDTTPPKALLVSQKVRDQVRREGLKTEMRRRDQWMNTSARRTASARSMGSTRASSIAAREDMMALMQSLNANSYDDIDGPVPASNTTMEVHLGSVNSDPTKFAAPTTKDMQYIDRLVNDTKISPSRYQNPAKHSSSYAPKSSLSAERQSAVKSKPRPHSARDGTLGATMRMQTTPMHQQQIQNPRTPRSQGGDVLKTRAQHFTEEKPFQPRTLKSNHVSTLSQFKYYNPPPQKRTDAFQSSELNSHGPTKSRGGPIYARPDTPMTNYTTESQDLMFNETLLSRDLNKGGTPTGVPPLDISLDVDHLSWLKEQSKKALVRTGRPQRARERNETVSRSQPLDTYAKVPDGYNHTVVPFSISSGLHSGRYPKTTTMLRVSHTEEELKYLEFVTDVTNDVLDRGIFTNRVLRQVFEHHIEKRKKYRLRLCVDTTA